MALTVTATEAATNSVNGCALTVLVFTGAQAVAGQTGAKKFANATTTPFMDQSLTTTVTGSQVVGCITDGSNNNAVTADARTTILENFEDTVQAASYNTWRATALTVTPGATTLGFSLPTGDNAVWGGAEILPNGSLAIDGSSPASQGTNSATTLTTASFTPPAGSLVVVLFAHCGSAVTATAVITNTGGLSFTNLGYLSIATGTGLGIWIADAGASGSPAPQTVENSLPPHMFPPLSRFFGPGAPFAAPVVAAAPGQVTLQGAATLGGQGSLSTAATQGAGTTLGGQGSVTNAATQGAPTTLGGAGALGNLATQGDGSGLGGAGLLTTGVTLGVITTLAGQGSLGNAATEGAGASLLAAGSLTASAVVGVFGTATLGGVGSLTNSVIQSVVDTLGGQGSLSTAATQIAGSLLGGTGSLGDTAVQGSGASLLGQGSLSAKAVLGAVSSLLGQGSLTNSVVQGVIATLAAAGSLTASSTTPGQGASTLGGAGSLGATVTQGVIATLLAQGSLTAGVTQGARSTLSAAGSLSASGLIISVGAATLAGAGVLILPHSILIPGGPLSGAGSLGTVSVLSPGAVLTGQGLLVAAGLVVTPISFGRATAGVLPVAAAASANLIVATASKPPVESGSARASGGQLATGTATAGQQQMPQAKGG